MNRVRITLLVGFAFLGGFWTAYLIQGYLLSKGLQFSIDLKFTKPSAPLSTLQPPAQEAAKSPTPMASAPQPTSPEVASPANQKNPPQSEGTSGPGKENELAEAEPEQAPGSLDISRAPPPATGAAEGASETASKSSGPKPTEAGEPAGSTVDRPPAAKLPEGQGAVAESSQAGEVAETSPGPHPQENTASEGFPAEAVVIKGDSLTKLVAKCYPGQEKLGLLGVILANPEIDKEGMVYSGQILNLPRINDSEQTMELLDHSLYSLYGSYYSAASWEKDKSWLEKNRVRFIVRVTQDANGRVIHRVFLGGYKTLAALKEAQDRLQTK